MFIRAYNKRIYIQKKKIHETWKTVKYSKKKKSTGINGSTYKHSQKTRENNQVGFEYVPVFFVLSFASIFI